MVRAARSEDRSRVCTLSPLEIRDAGAHPGSPRLGPLSRAGYEPEWDAAGYEFPHGEYDPRASSIDPDAFSRRRTVQPGSFHGQGAAGDCSARVEVRVMALHDEVRRARSEPPRPLSSRLQSTLALQAFGLPYGVDDEHLGRRRLACAPKASRAACIDRAQAAAQMSNITGVLHKRPCQAVLGEFPSLCPHSTAAALHSIDIDSRRGRLYTAPPQKPASLSIKGRHVFSEERRQLQHDLSLLSPHVLQPAKTCCALQTTRPQKQKINGQIESKEITAKDDKHASTWKKFMTAHNDVYAKLISKNNGRRSQQSAQSGKSLKTSLLETTGVNDGSIGDISPLVSQSNSQSASDTYSPSMAKHGHRGLTLADTSTSVGDSFSTPKATVRARIEVTPELEKQGLSPVACSFSDSKTSTSAGVTPDFSEQGSTIAGCSLFAPFPKVSFEARPDLVKDVSPSTSHSSSDPIVGYNVGDTPAFGEQHASSTGHRIFAPFPRVSSEATPEPSEHGSYTLRRQASDVKASVSSEAASEGQLPSASLVTAAESMPASAALPAMEIGDTSGNLPPAVAQPAVAAAPASGDPAHPMAPTVSEVATTSAMLARPLRRVLFALCSDVPKFSTEWIARRVLELQAIREVSKMNPRTSRSA